jgi:hypothetical protein
MDELTPSRYGRACGTESPHSNASARLTRRLPDLQSCATPSEFDRVLAPKAPASESRIPAIFRLPRKSRNTFESGAWASARWRKALSPNGSARAESPALVTLVRARSPSFRCRWSRAALCISPRELRCGCRCGQAAALKFSKRSAESAAANSGTRAWDPQKIRTAAGYFIAIPRKIFIPIQLP